MIFHQVQHVKIIFIAHVCTSYLPVLGRILKGQGKRAKNGTHLYLLEIIYRCLCKTNEIQERFKGEVNESHLTKISNPRSWRQMKCICTFSLLGKQKKREDPTFSAFLREIHQHHFRAPFHFCAPFFWGRYTNTFCAPFHFCAPFFWGRYNNTFCAPFHFCAPFFRERDTSTFSVLLLASLLGRG